ncbi:hypothetical protein L9G15_25410, partial [Shewanella sp. A3A]|nr:hypothetical protein [Shewanella ferrihydritica]
ATATLTIDVNGKPTIGKLDVEGYELNFNEANLADGSAPSATALTSTGEFTFTTDDGLKTISIAGHSFNLAALNALNTESVVIST